jgi:hypothetical protein
VFGAGEAAAAAAVFRGESRTQTQHVRALNAHAFDQHLAELNSTICKLL